jgi:hypothetical protein
MSEFKTPEKKRVRINEERNVERLDSGNFPKEKRKLFTITPYDVHKAHRDIENENRYGVGPGGLMTGPELSDVYENNKYPESKTYQNLWGTIEFNPKDDFSIELLKKGGKKSRKFRKSRKSKKSRKSRKTRKTKRKH